MIKSLNFEVGTPCINKISSPLATRFASDRDDRVAYLYQRVDSIYSLSIWSRDVKFKSSSIIFRPLRFRLYYKVKPTIGMTVSNPCFQLNVSNLEFLR